MVHLPRFLLGSKTWGKSWVRGVNYKLNIKYYFYAKMVLRYCGLRDFKNSHMNDNIQAFQKHHLNAVGYLKMESCVSAEEQLFLLVLSWGNGKGPDLSRRCLRLQPTSFALLLHGEYRETVWSWACRAPHPALLQTLSMAPGCFGEKSTVCLGHRLS